MTIIQQVKLKDAAIDKILTFISKEEKVKLDELKQNILTGKVVVLKNIKSKNKKIVAVGKNLTTKVNANIGTSPDLVDIKFELQKLHYAVNAKTDTIMDLSTGGNLDFIRKTIVDTSPVPVGTVPLYQVVCETLKQGRQIKDISKQHIFEVIEKNAEDGVDFITVHCGVTKKNLEILRKHRRVCGIVSRGGAFLAEWVIKNNKENPLYEYFEDLLKIAKKYNLTLSLGDGLRPGAIADANDKAQIAELKTLCELAKIANKEDVQVMIEGPGHMPLDTIEKHVKLEKKLSCGKPFYLLGPLVTDIAAGYDHINSAIGAAVAAMAGADFICYVTPAEHLRLPTPQDVYEGVISARIAAHAADIVKRKKYKVDQVDLQMSIARKKLNWKTQQKYVIDTSRFVKERKKIESKTDKVCSMCGSYCAMRESTKIGI
ncbi:MAG: phosphomethylpyrimidine synthase ThiC [Endomicrobia bacterium]|nr:phosphomethylpyrimidine synthase ThiC [Endomicrobiia bacterium]